jgi:NADH-quinone oxidoreductase subunit J
MNATAGYLIYGLAVLGAAGIYFALPAESRSRGVRRAGALVALAALIGAFVWAAVQFAGQAADSILSYVFAAIAIAAAARVITSPRAVYCVLWFVLVVISVAAMLVLQAAEFLAAALVIIYAGAVLVTYLFVLMLAQQTGTAVYDARAREPAAAVVAGFALMAAVAMVLSGHHWSVNTAWPAVPFAEAGSTRLLGQAVLTYFVVALELAGLLLLVAIIGAVALARRRLPADQDVTQHPGEPSEPAGRHVPPF